jgi:hypothetical protein
MTSWTWNILTGSTNTPGAISRWLNKSTLTSGDGGDADLILSEAVSWISTRLRVWQQLSVPTLSTMTIGSDQLALPTQMQEIDTIWIAGVAGGQFYQQELTQIDPTALYRLWSFDGTGARIPQTPIAYSFTRSFIQLDSPADLAYPYYLTYYQDIPDLSITNTTNFLTTTNLRLLRVVTMMLGAEWAKESNQGQYDRTYWEQQAEAEIQNVQAQSDMARRAQVSVPRYPGGSVGGYVGGYDAGYPA